MGSLAPLRWLSLCVIVRTDLRLAPALFQDPTFFGRPRILWRGVQVLPVSVWVRSGSSSFLPHSKDVHSANKLIGDLIMTLGVNFLYVSAHPQTAGIGPTHSCGGGWSLWMDGWMLHMFWTSKTSVLSHALFICSN